MKIFKYVIALIAAFAMTFSFSSCSRELDPDNPNDGKSWYRCDIVLDNPGSLSEADQTVFANTVDVTIGLDKNEAHPYTFCKKDYMETNFNNIVALDASKNDIIQKIIIPVAQQTGVKDFTVKFVLQERKTTTDSEGNQVNQAVDLKTVIYKASDFAN